MRVWITRTLPEANATAERLAALGHGAVVAPVLAAQPIPGVTLDLAAVDALALTSAHAIAAVAPFTDRRDVPVFAVGDATADHARSAGFTNVRSAGGDAAALADLVARARPGRVLYAGPREPAADLVGLLAERGVSAYAVAVYETIPTGIGGPPSDADAVLIHSAWAAELAKPLIESAGRLDLAAYAISPAAARPLAHLGLKLLRSAPFSNEAALLDLLPR